MNLAERVQTVADLAGNLDSQDQFTEAYAQLLAEFTEAMRLMRALAGMQVAYLGQQAGNLGRMN